MNALANSLSTTYQKIEGLVAAPFTPLRPDRSINLSAIADYAQWLHSQRVVGAFICGTTGEGISLTTPERMQIAEEWVRCAPPDLKVIVHVGHACLADCQTLASHAQSIGAHSVSCLSPFFFKPNGLLGLVDWCAAVASSASRLPFYFYHIPSMTGVNHPIHEFLSHASQRIPNLVGVKYTYEDLADCERSAQFANGKYDILFGRDEKLLSSLRFGIRGAVGSTYNFAAPIYHRVISAFQKNDESTAQQMQSLATQMIEVLIQGGPSPIATFKWYMSQTGIDCGPTRFPLIELTQEQKESLSVQLDKLGLSSVLSQGVLS